MSDLTNHLASLGYTPEHVAAAEKLMSRYLDTDQLLELAPGVYIGSCLQCGAALMVREDEAGQPDTALSRHITRHSHSFMGGF